MLDPALIRLAETILADARVQGLKIVTAESCTGGLVAAYFTEVPGSSLAFDRGFVTYSNDAKIDMLGVPKSLLREHGAVSEPCVRAMAAGALDHAADAQLAVAITGIAGPGGGSADKPVGLVHFAANRRGQRVVHERRLFGDIGRDKVRLESVRQALEMLAALL